MPKIDPAILTSHHREPDSTIAEGLTTVAAELEEQIDTFPNKSYHQKSRALEQLNQLAVNAQTRLYLVSNRISQYLLLGTAVTDKDMEIMNAAVRRGWLALKTYEKLDKS